MAKPKVEDIIFELVDPITMEYECELVDVEFKKEGGNWFLRIFIDKLEGVTLDDCEAVSRKISEMLDEKDPIEQSYYLEVSSPGLDRPLKKDKDFERFTGEQIEIKLYKQLDGKKMLLGKLEDYKEGIITIVLEDGSSLEIDRKKTALVRLAVEY